MGIEWVWEGVSDLTEGLQGVNRCWRRLVAVTWLLGTVSHLYT